jgi:hypothetical protein
MKKTAKPKMSKANMKEEMMENKALKKPPKKAVKEMKKIHAKNGNSKY